MLFYVYVIKSLKDKGYYIGSTKNLNVRLYRHSHGLVASTKHRLPIKLVYIEKYSTLSEARKREMKLKSFKGGNAFKNLLGLK